MTTRVMIMPGYEAYVAERIRQLKKEKDLTELEIVGRYKKVRAARHPDREDLKMSRDIFQKILRRERRLKGEDFDILAAVFGVTVDKLVGADELVDISQLDPTKNHGQFVGFHQLLGSQLRVAGELLSFGEFMPCSLETEELMCQHHESIFDFYPDSAIGRLVARSYDAIGNKQRERLLEAGHTRPWVFRHMIFESDLARIFDKSDKDYIACSREVRIKFADHLIELLTKVPTWKIDLMIIPDEHRRRLRPLQDVDSLVVVRDQSGSGTFSFWRNHVGVVWFTTSSTRIRDALDTLLEVTEVTRADSAEYVHRLLRHHREEVSRWYA